MSKENLEPEAHAFPLAQALARVRSLMLAVGEAETHLQELAGRLDAAEHGSALGIEVLEGVDRIAARAGDLLRGAETELLVLSAPPYAQITAATIAHPSRPPEVEAEESETAKALHRGVSVREIIAKEGLAGRGRVDGISTLSHDGLQIRTRVEVPTKLVVADRRTALLPPSSRSDVTAIALVLHDGLFADVLVALFELLWESSVPIGEWTVEGHPAADRGPTPDEQALLWLLAGGLKDEAIARQLQVHVHTARRRISALLDELGAATRFQAGLQAARRGWL